MKKYFLSIFLVISAQVYAESKIVEFDQTQEAACYAQLQKVGCQEGDDKCIEAKKAQLTDECRGLESDKKKYRKR